MLIALCYLIYQMYPVWSCLHFAIQLPHLKWYQPWAPMLLGYSDKAQCGLMSKVTFADQLATVAMALHCYNVSLLFFAHKLNNLECRNSKQLDDWHCFCLFVASRDVCWMCLGKCLSFVCPVCCLLVNRCASNSQTHQLIIHWHIFSCHCITQIVWHNRIIDQ